MDDAKTEELLLEFTGHNTTRSIKAFAPEGISLESNLEGEAHGVFDSTFYATFDALAKPDGTIEYETRQIHTTTDGQTVLIELSGTSTRVSPTQNRFVGQNTFRTASEQLGWLNGITARHEGEYDPVVGEQRVRVYGTR
ncbi:hypothetical protein G3T36_17200 [Diaminobutyricibacter tongyongensis]|uniref:DUF3237 domain-containing protein n=1 Tax=Leifsonia tongyongensis TaxID=1268043 RepID=A0A6L9Y2T5_9MICO|nr:hypothetical protein [Diaminobutyricibacter tongyongensis]NEN07598.1 hypothetical protein [Diaminobutyricibacter tongyongensis]